jgi:predicted XRE-type DNA-binding protein
MSVKGRSARGERSGSAKLRQEQVEIIRVALSGEALTCRQIATLADVSASTISLIGIGKTWKVLDD